MTKYASAPVVRLEATRTSKTTPQRVRTTCPSCGAEAVLERASSGFPDLESGRPNAQGNFQTRAYCGIRRCPDEECSGLVFFFKPASGDLITYPSALRTVELGEVPSSVQQSVKEAIVCEANGCYVAAAIMIRRAIEEICHLVGTTGGNLEKRIDSLEGKAMLPADLIKSLHHIRFLGNDAAHVEARHFADVGRDEIEAGLALLDMLLGSLYRYKTYANAIEALRVDRKPAEAK